MWIVTNPIFNLLTHPWQYCRYLHNCLVIWILTPEDLQITILVVLYYFYPSLEMCMVDSKNQLYYTNCLNVHRIHFTYSLELFNVLYVSDPSSGEDIGSLLSERKYMEFYFFLSVYLKEEEKNRCTN